jgi:hypothetical protein
MKVAVTSTAVLGAGQVLRVACRHDHERYSGVNN